MEYHLYLFTASHIPLMYSQFFVYTKLYFFELAIGVIDKRLAPSPKYPDAVSIVIIPFGLLTLGHLY